MIAYRKYQFHCVWTSDAHMPSYWGSALRGGMGRWLRKASCVLRSRMCDGCVMRDTCAYGFIFETEGMGTGPKGAINARPHPIVLEPPVPAPRDTREGEGFSFTVLLIGKGNEFFHYLVYSLVKLGIEDGIGARTRDGCGRFRITSITSNGEVVFGKDTNGLRVPSGLQVLGLQAEGDSTGSEDVMGKEVTVELVTPLRVKHNGRFSREVPFHLLVRAALRRIASLESFYGDGEPDLAYASLVKGAEEIETTHSDLRWQDVPRYSSRQRRKMLIGGPVGQVSYHGDLAPYIPLLRYCEQVHLGKQTFFGLGKMALTKTQEIQ